MPLLTTAQSTEHVTVSVTQNEIKFSHRNENFVWLLSDCEFVWKDESLDVVSEAGMLTLTLAEVELLKDQSSFFRRHDNLKTWAKYLAGTATFILALFYLVILGVRLGSESISHRITLKQEKKWFSNNTLNKEPSVALSALLKQIEPKSDIQIYIHNSDEVNAYALPGAQILVTRNLICESESSEELLGIIAHEVGHVEKRHVIKGTLSAIGTTALVTILVGGDYGSMFVADSINRKFSVEDESEADSFAKEKLTQNHISTVPVAEFFERFMKTEKEKNGKALIQISEFLSDHPPTDSRISFFKKEQDMPEETAKMKAQTEQNRKLWADLLKEAKCSEEKTAGF